MSACLYCRRRLESNEDLEHLRFGHRFAYDPARGRLWSVCPVCRGWMLRPGEERWAALEELECRARDPGSVLARTAHVELRRCGSLSLVRIGPCGREEEAWWRYGDQLRGCGRGTALAGALELGAWAGAGIATLGLIAPLGMYLCAMDNPRLVERVVRRRRFGTVLWRGASSCGRCGAVLDRLSFHGGGRLRLERVSEDARPTLRLGCSRCGNHDAGAAHRWAGPEAETMLRRFLAFQNFHGGDERQVKSAAETVAEAGGPDRYLEEVAGWRSSLGDLSRTYRRIPTLALEIAANEEVERRLLDGRAPAPEAREATATRAANTAGNPARLPESGHARPDRAPGPAGR